MPVRSRGTAQHGVLTEAYGSIRDIGEVIADRPVLKDARVADASVRDPFTVAEHRLIVARSVTGPLMAVTHLGRSASIECGLRMLDQ